MKIRSILLSRSQNVCLGLHNMYRNETSLCVFEDISLFACLPTGMQLTLEYAQRVFFQASPETILYDASAADKIHQAKSTTRGVLTKIQPFVEAVEQYGQALDVYSNVYPLVMGPPWGSVRVVLHVCGSSKCLRYNS